MNRTVILAVCGKSASGKNSFVKILAKELKRYDIPYSLIISDTTRPPRDNEKFGQEYYFLSLGSFLNKKYYKQYLEVTKFNNWYYGTDKNSIVDNVINIGIFNPKSLILLQKYNHKYLIVPIYLNDSLTTRLWRSYKREGQWKFEYFRRAFMDWINFFNINFIVQNFRYYIKFNNEFPSLKKKVKQTLWLLEKWNLIF